MNPVRVLVADSQLLFGQALAAGLASRSDIEVIPSTPTNGIEAIKAAVSHRPDVLIMDSHLRGTSVSTVIAAIRERTPQCRVTVLAWFATPGDLEAALREGASAVLLKNVTLEHLALAIHQVSEGADMLLSHELEAAVVQKIKNDASPLPAGDPDDEDVYERVASLTPRELEVLDILSTGVRLEEAATVLGIEPKTLRNHVHRLSSKLGVRSRVEAVALAHRYQVILPGRYAEGTSAKQPSRAGRRDSRHEASRRSPVKVLVADAQLLFSDSLAVALSRHADIETSHQRPTDASDALYAVAQHKPDVAILDFWMDGCAEVMQPEVLDSFAPCRILFSSWVHSSEHIKAALRAGAAGFIPKTTSLDRLADAVRRAAEGEMLVYGEQLASMVEAIERRDQVAHEVYDRFLSLTGREREVLSLLARGFALDEAARQLHVTRGAVRYHVRNVTKKTGARSIPEAVAMAGWSGFGTF